MGRAKLSVPLRQRLGDLLHILTFAVMLTIAFTIDIISGTAPTGYRLANGTSVWGVSLEGRNWWPPQFFYEATLSYCVSADQVFCHNPMWMKVMAVWSPLFYGPFYLFAMYAFAKGRDWIRVPGLMWAWGMFMFLTVIMCEEWGGDYPSQDFPVAFIANLYYWVYPLILMWRLRRKRVFTVYKTKPH